MELFFMWRLASAIFSLWVGAIRKPKFHVRLIDLTNKSAVIDSFGIRAPSQGEALERVFELVKRRPVYKKNDHVRDFVRFHEEGGAAYMAGFEFGDLPEALRRVHIEVSASKNRQKEDRNGY